MKRSASSTPPSSPLITPKSERSTELNDDYLPDSKPSIDGSPSPSPNKKSRAPASSPKKARAKPNGIASKGANITSASGEVGGWEAGWTADKKEAIVARLISLGIKSANMSDLGQEVCSSI
jgi:hypothetical protein